jgi:hypothetical protein
MHLLTTLLPLFLHAPAATQPLRPLPVLLTTVCTTAQAPAADTIAALHRLFTGRRLRRNLIATSLGAGVVVGAVATATTASDHSGSRGYGSLSTGPVFGGADWLVVYAIPVAPLIALDFVVYAKYSRKEEARAIAAFQAHHLPVKIRRKLKLRYFNTL